MRRISRVFVGRIITVNFSFDLLHDLRVTHQQVKSVGEHARGRIGAGNNREDTVRQKLGSVRRLWVCTIFIVLVEIAIEYWKNALK